MTAGAAGASSPAPRQPRLLFVHGAGGSARSWDLQRLAFPGAIAPDLPGHAGGVGFRRVDAYGEWLQTTAAERRWPPVLFVGHSMGGALAQWYALEHPVDLAGVVLVATGARLRVHPELLELLRTDYPRAVEQVIERSLAERADGRLAARLREAMLAVPRDVTLGDFEACDAFDVLGRLERIRLPTLVIVGSEDRMTPPRFAEYLHGHISGSHLIVIDGAGHAVHLERPREVNRAILEFRESL
jgi:pimeloyl-ACP methyl ester carboxylesterase